jgi:hypothetical protein
MNSIFSFEDLKHKLWWEIFFLFKMTICLLLIKPQRNTVEWLYIKYNIKKVFQELEFMFFKTFQLKLKCENYELAKLWEKLWDSQLGKIEFFCHFNVIPITNHKLY